ncbi:MAG TPA: hypothetical protein VFW40_04195 [Capsulimonadaceae bacterium]|nr:hypothetical protein [Capsulimonadaceae bacterium]
MSEREPKKSRKGRTAKKQAGERRAGQPRSGLVMAIATGTGLGAFIGLLIGFLLTPRSRAATRRESRQMLAAWQDMVRKLSDRLQVGETD